MRISILGIGNPEKIIKHTSMTEQELNKLVVDLARLIAEKGHELVIIPDRGLSTDIARLYSENRGKKVYGVVPSKDRRYGTKHIEPYLNLIDERIEFDSWYDVDGEVAAVGDVCIAIGMSAGVMRDVSVLKYHYKYLKSKTRLFWFRNTISAPMHKEIEQEIPVTYIDSVEELKRFI